VASMLASDVASGLDDEVADESLGDYLGCSSLTQVRHRVGIMLEIGERKLWVIILLLDAFYNPIEYRHHNSITLYGLLIPVLI
jgi:hypothetical protein